MSEHFEIPLDAPVYVISVAAEMAGMHPQTLRQYDRLGLVTPTRTMSGGRRYSLRDIVLLRAGWDRVESLDTPEFWTRAPYMTAEACRWLLARGIKAIAYDFPQDHCIRDYVTGERSPSFEENTTHVELLLKGIPMFEYLCNMNEIRQERVQFHGLPIKIPDCDGAPVRAIAIEET